LDFGDYLTNDDYNQAAPGFKEFCTSADGEPLVEPSSWHGTHVTGTIIGQGTANETASHNGVLGGASQARVIPVRVLGKCGGFISDVINGMMWAGGFELDGIPKNQHQAQIINLSLGSQGSCGEYFQDAINQLTAHGILVVVAAGNSAEDVSTTEPANCANVISVAAVGPTNNLAYYSNYGAVTIAASGGDSDVSFNGGIWSTIYTSTTGYGENGNCGNSSACYGYTAYQGTSMATPHVVAALADIMQVRQNLSYDQARDLLRASATPFSGCNWGQTGCVGSGRLNANSLINYVVNNVLVLRATPGALGFVGNQSSTASFSNLNPAPITIGKVEIIGPNASNFKISSTSCSGTLAPNASCAVTLTPLNLQANTAFAATLVVYNSSNQIIAQVGLIPQSPTTPSSHGSGGGCSMIANGDDGTLTTILLAVATLMWLRRNKTT
jgi:serine protease